MIHIKQISPIATILLDAAKARRTATYTAIYRAFGKEVPNKDVFDTVEAAARALSYSTFAIYSAVLAKKDTGLPGSGFFDIYRNVRLAEYKDIAGNTILQHLTQEQQQKMVDLERPRVYAHANEHF